MTENKKPHWKKLPKLEHLILAAIILLGLFLRIYKIGEIPAGFFCDEAAIGYNAYTLLTTGKDEYGVPYPIFFRSFGDYRLPIPIYANMLTIGLGGLTEVNVRLTAILFGIISIIFTSLIAKNLFGKNIGLCTALILAIMPWHIHLSRWGSEYIYFPTLFSIAFYFFLKGMRDAKKIIVAFFFFGLTLYTYYPSLFITPLFIAGAILFAIMQKNRQTVIPYLSIGIFIFFLFCIPLVIGYKNGILLTRWNSVNTTDLSVEKKILQTSKFYIMHFSPDFLFLKGDSGLPGHFVTRHSVKGLGELYLFLLPLLLYGGYALLTKYKNKSVLIIWLLLLYPLGSSITNDGPLATRSVIGLLPLSIIAAVGLAEIFQKINTKRPVLIKTTCFGLLTIIILSSIIHYAFNYYVQYPQYSSDFWGWQYGPREIITYFKTQQNNYDDLVMIREFNAPHIFFKFYAPDNCQKCHLGTPTEILDPTKKQLFALTPRYLQQNPTIKFKTKKTIYYPNTKVAFQIGEVVQ